MGIQQASCPAGAHLHAALHRVAAHTCPSAKNASVACVSLQVGETGLNRKPDRLVNNHKTPQTPQTRMSSPANALLCNIRERKQFNLLSYFLAPQQQLCGTRSCGKSARKGHFHAQHTCTHTRRQSAQTPTLPQPKASQTPA
jgi:hypothetical protein